MISPLRNANRPAPGDQFFGEVANNRNIAPGNKETSWNLVKRAKTYLENNDAASAIEILRQVPELQELRRSNLKARRFLNDLLDFSKEYQKLYGAVV